MRIVKRATVATLLVLLSGSAEAIVIRSTNDPGDFMHALSGVDTGITITNVTIDGHVAPASFGSPPGAPLVSSTGVYTNASGVYDGIKRGIVLSTGDVNDYADGPRRSETTSTAYTPRATEQQRLLAQQVTGGDYGYWDVTQIDITFDAAESTQHIIFDLVFGTEEWPEFLGSKFNDGFGAFLNGTNFALLDDAGITSENQHLTAAVSGTELNALLAPGGDPLLQFVAAVEAGSTDNVLSFLLFDTSDSILDTTVYISNLTHNPEPGTGVLLGLGMCALAAATRRRARLT
jgi:hypothetical protein